MLISRPLLISLGIARVYAATATTSAQTSSITGCHSHGSSIYCIDGEGHEVLVSATSTPTTGVPAQYTGCHSHGSESYCVDGDGNDVLIQEEETEAEETEHSHSEDSTTEESSSEAKQSCHFHAGVEHCVSEGESETSASSCGIQARDYNVPLRIGTLFVVLVTSGIGVFAPILLMKLPYASINGVVSTVIKQFGTGIILATAFIHLYTHANLMFTNECLGELEYEATTSAVVMAGIFIAFLLEYVGHRIIVARRSKKSSAETIPSESQQTHQKEEHDHSQDQQQQPTLACLGHNHGSFDHTGPDSKFSVIVMEAGILFHSILIGLTLVVAGDSFYKTLLVVIVFHQFFEGLALGARIAILPGAIFPSKAIMAGAFALITPIGMAIGLGVLHTFNGNSRNTLIALGTLDALSAGILVWVGIVDMWARDWVIEGGEMLHAKLGKVLTGGISLVSGLVLMGLLGKWA
ncbi:uncharacterized protein N7479_007206 [Penicillium vulpinum]|uniref:uncharacterized protein n=1 Tax=Penicillium vulpinum TaxID=29845 RepID=UPI0025486527|nr:uncharacterized protein N7479_007206 [Penicillium vulpinum]KAJ5960056.1 hypothetical protein N7479_007206 [Penicillium vulpinum]